MGGKCLVNQGKQEFVGQGRNRHQCLAIRTKVVLREDKLEDIIEEFARPVVMEGDILFISEKMVACTQGRAVPLEDIRPGFWAALLSRFVVKRPGGIGLGMPETMQCAIQECGLPRILVASAVGAVGKLFGKRGWFYRVAGWRAASIDGPCHWTLPPYNRYVVLGPENPENTAKEISCALGGKCVLVVDLNDFGGKILGCSHPDADQTLLLDLLAQNPLGQSGQCTPMGVLRPSLQKEVAGQGTEVETPGNCA